MIDDSLFGIRDKTVETTSFVEAVIMAERMADDRRWPVYLREIGEGAWRVRERPLPYYSSAEIEILPEGFRRVSAPRSKPKAPRP